MKIEEIIRAAQKENRVWLIETEAKQILAEAGIDVVTTKLARTASEAVSISDELGYPVALKVVSPDIIHKSDLGGVKLRLQDRRAVEMAYGDIVDAVARKCPGATVKGVSVQRMARSGVEVILGMNKDPQFGPVLMFGIGGILVELLKDVSFRIVPLERSDATEMIHEIKGFPLLTGYRGREPVDLAKLEEMLLRLSDLAENYPQIKELDINPVFAYRDGAVAVDARIRLDEPA